MLELLDLTRVLVIDIETVSQQARFNQLDDRWQALWAKKSAVLNAKNELSPADSYGRAAIYAEFGKVICISAGYFQHYGSSWQFRIKSFYGHNEKEILEGFSQMLNRYFGDPDHLLCAHNGKEFDYPYLSRRCLIQGIEVPRILQIAGKKPWEVTLLDTMELWKFGDYKAYTSLDLLAASFGIPTPKDTMDGSEVGAVYWEQQNIEQIRTYCQKDIVTVAQILLRFRNEKLLDDDQIIVTD